MNDLKMIKTLEEAQAAVRDGVDEGIICPCCGQYARVYTRRLNASMARALIALSHEQERVGAAEWLRAQDVMANAGLPPAIAASGDYAKLRYWGFIERPEGGERKDGSKRVGLWRVTMRGRAFAENLIAAPDRMMVYPGGKEVSVQGAPRKLISQVLCSGGFNFDELTGRKP